MYLQSARTFNFARPRRSHFFPKDSSMDISFDICRHCNRCQQLEVELLRKPKMIFLFMSCYIFHCWLFPGLCAYTSAAKRSYCWLSFVFFSASPMHTALQAPDSTQSPVASESTAPVLVICLSVFGGIVLVIVVVWLTIVKGNWKNDAR